MIRVLVTDDHPVVREGIRRIISETEDITVTAEAGTAEELLDRIRRDAFDVVLLDITLPGMSGLEVLKQVRSEKPDLPVLILSVHTEEQYAIRGLKMGASGYLTKSSAPDELIHAIRAISRGDRFITASLSDKLVDWLQRPDASRLPHEQLSDREYEVFCLIAEGKSVSEIARQLLLSPKTVSTYRTRILDKMELKNNAELMQYAIRNGLVALD